LSFYCHASRNLGLITITIVCIVYNCTFCIQLMYLSHHSLTRHLNDSNVNSTYCVHSWHEEAFIQLVKKKKPSSSVTSFCLKPMVKSWSLIQSILGCCPHNFPYKGDIRLVANLMQICTSLKLVHSLVFTISVLSSPYYK